MPAVATAALPAATADEKATVAAWEAVLPEAGSALTAVCQQ